jgi:hypothetical protein
MPGSGSKSVLRLCPLHDRFSAKSRHSSARLERPFRAKTGREQLQQTVQCSYSITSSARASKLAETSMPMSQMGTRSPLSKPDVRFSREQTLVVPAGQAHCFLFANGRAAV